MSEHQTTEQVEAAELLQTTNYDRAASMLISLLILAVSSVAVLVALWVAYGIQRGPAPRIIKFGTGGGERLEASGESGFESPQLEELADMPVVDALSTMQAALGHEAIQAASTLDVGGLTGSPGAAPGSDPTRPAGPPERVPRWERWEIRYSAATLQAYARQLDFFKIELGAAGGKADVDYASGFTKSTSTVRTGKGADEKRLYLTWREGRLLEWDRTLLTRSGVDVEHRIVMQFYPQQLEQTLARLEAEAARGKTVDQIVKTFFELKPHENGYKFVVAGQRFR